MKLRLLFLVFLATYFNCAIAQPTVGTWANTGPILFPVNVSGQVDGMGRVCQVKFDPVNSQKMYAVSASGGLFISANNGQTWAPTPGTEQLATTACSAVCIDFTNTNILYLSTGDPDYYNDDYGIWKSTNGGVSWAQSNSGIGNRMAVEILMAPNDHNTIVAATDDGIWKSTNAGATWVEKQTGGDFRSMVMKPTSTTVLYAASSKNYYKSTDFGDTWTQITNGLLIPANNGGLRLAVSQADTDVVYIGTTDSNGIIMKSTDAGQSFSVVYVDTSQCLVCYDPNPSSGSQGNYNFALTANPVNPNELLLVSHCVWRSTDGGITWSNRTQWWNQCHTDMHDIKFNPYNNQQRFNANDGGVWLSTDTLATNWQPWSNGLSATEIYHAAQSPIIRQMISIGTQDNGELYFDNTWKCNRGGDWGPVCAFDYLPDANVYYLGEGNRRTLQPLGGDQTYNSPFVPTNNGAFEFVPSISNMAFIGADSLWVSSNINTASPTWTLINPFNETVHSIASCHADSNILYVVTNNNHLYRSDNALASSPIFTTVNTPGFSYGAASIATDKHNSNIVYLSCGNRIYRSVNKGVSWSNITANLPNLNILKVISDDYSTNERLFVSLGSYVYFKDNTSTSWTNTIGLPTIPQVTDMMIYNDGTGASILRLSTYGRGVWELNINNNLPPVAEFTSDKQYICPADTIRFAKTIFGNYSSFVWSFPGGNPSSSTADSPVVVYPANGSYDAQLIAISANGNDTILKNAYIVVSNGQGGTVQEGFEGAAFLPAAWLGLSSSSSSWQRVDTVGGFGLSMHSAYFDNYNFDAGGKHDRIVTPQIDLHGALNAYATFDVAYAFYSGYRDSLQVEVSTDCDKTFTPVYEKDSTILATAPDTTAYFVPTAAQWRKDTIWLNAYFGNSISLAFDNIGHYGQPIYIDNINLAVTLAVNKVENDLFVDAYPNPTSGIVYLKGSGINGSNATISCYNIIGSLVRKLNVSVRDKKFSTGIDLSGMPPGLYEFSIATDAGDNVTKPVIIK